LLFFENLGGYMKKFILLLACLSLLACSAITGRLSGTYVAQSGGLIDSIRFESDGVCHTISSLGEYSSTVAMQYEVKGNKVYIGTMGQMAPAFEVVDSTTLEGITFGFGGLYRKKR
jgi:hypothetical protein